MSKFKSLLKMIEEGLLKPMDDAEVESTRGEDEKDFFKALANDEDVYKAIMESPLFDEFMKTLPTEDRRIIFQWFRNALLFVGSPIRNVSVVDCDENEKLIDMFEYQFPNIAGNRNDLGDNASSIEIIKDAIVRVAGYDDSGTKIIALLVDKSKFDKWKQEHKSA